MVISGTEHVEIPDHKRYREVQPSLQHDCPDDVDGEVPRHGTSVNINVLNWLKACPPRNFQSFSFPEAENIERRDVADSNLSPGYSCALSYGVHPHPSLKSAFLTHHRVRGQKGSPTTTSPSTPWDRTSECRAQRPLAKLDRCLRAARTGTSWSAGVVLAWATEAYERDIISPQEDPRRTLQWERTLKAI